jgi:methionyl aminopeptidase
MIVEREEDIAGLKAVGRVCAAALRTMMKAVQPGMTTAELDDIGRAVLEKAGAKSAPVSLYRFPGATCISVSPVIAHGIPGDRVLREGELINIDVSAEMDGYFGDTGASMVVAAQIPEYEKIIAAAKSALEKALQAARAGQTINGIGKAVQTEAKRRGYGVIYNLTGHGIGRHLHEEPIQVFNYFKPRDRYVLKEGLVLAIEPFLTAGKGRVLEEADGWSLRTTDRAIAAQFEHTVIVTEDGPMILTI